SGYARGLSVDFALLRAESGFASDVTPIPLADRYPDESAGVTNFGCPRCEWPSMQVLKMRSASSQVLRWHPEAIGGRSGSSLIDYADGSPKVVGLLTWGGGGEGLGQSTPFLLDAMRGRMPKSFEPLPMYAREMAAFQTPEIPRQAVCQIDGAIPPFRESSGLLVSAFSPTDTASGQTPSGYIGSITDGGQTVDNPPEDDAQPDESRLIDRIRERPKQPSTEDDEGTGFFNRQPRAPGFFERIGILFGKVVWCIIGFAVGFTVAKLAPLFSPVNALKALFSK
ncbi:MAG: hypothetical protein KDA71_05765, partial [Planctomycetales bacterium]|nr:hypothetical protein [Planctomycetales bacterium]